VTFTAALREPVQVGRRARLGKRKLTVERPCYCQHVDDQEAPILGTEPLPVELANTFYGDGADRVDFMAGAEAVDRWFREIGRFHPDAPSPDGLGRVADQVRGLRDGVHRLLSAAADGRPPDPEAIAEVNRMAAAAPTTVELRWTADGNRTARVVDATTGPVAVMGRIATCCIELLAGPVAQDVRRCRAPGCSMLFVKNHSRRRWCHPSCGHRDRQARYYRRRRVAGAQ
jgi:predicted RNA-binding Zn ribbon-like protein